MIKQTQYEHGISLFDSILDHNDIEQIKLDYKNDSQVMNLLTDYESEKMNTDLIFEALKDSYKTLTSIKSIALELIELHDSGQAIQTDESLLWIKQIHLHANFDATPSNLKNT